MQYIKRKDKPTIKNKACKSMLKMDWDSQRSNKEDHEPLNKLLSQYLSHTCNFAAKYQYSQLSSNTCCPPKWYQSEGLDTLTSSSLRIKKILTADCWKEGYSSTQFERCTITKFEKKKNEHI